MKVASILKAKGTSVQTVSPGTTIEAAARLLRDKNIGALVVSEDGTTVLGLISERDLVNALAVYGTRVSDLRVSDLMVRQVVTCMADDTDLRVMALMTHHRVRHVPVVESGLLKGIVSIGDVVKHRLDELQTEANVLREAFLARR